MQIITKDEVRFKGQEILDRIDQGEVFIYPTDTIYGIGCDATNPESVNKIREIKQRFETPFSVIAPSIEWITKNCEISKETESYIKDLPGPITLILQLKNKNCVAQAVNPDKDSLGVRIPKHWITNMISALNKPIVTTSVNLTDKPFMKEVDDLDTSISSHVDFAIDEGHIDGSPSNIIHLEGDETKIRER